jgi:hypothetical protein
LSTREPIVISRPGRYYPFLNGTDVALPAGRIDYHVVTAFTIINPEWPCPSESFSSADCLGAQPFPYEWSVCLIFERSKTGGTGFERSAVPVLSIPFL